MTQSMVEILQRWQEETGTEVIDFKAASRWATENGLYQKDPISPQRQCEADMRRAVQRATYLNARYEKIRIYGATRLTYEGEQLPLFYVDMRIAKPDVAKDVFDLNFRRIANDVKRHSIEKQSYDDFNPYEAMLPMYDYDFNAEADAGRLTGQYDDSYDEDEGIVSEDGDE